MNTPTPDSPAAVRPADAFSQSYAEARAKFRAVAAAAGALGIGATEDLTTVPQRFACVDLDATEAEVAAQLARSRSRLFLLGIGHVKSGLLHRLNRHANCVFLDVGQGIDALAGIIDKEKPFFGGWTNFRANNPSLYDELDYLSYLPYEFVHAY